MLHYQMKINPPDLTSMLIGRCLAIYKLPPRLRGSAEEPVGLRPPAPNNLSEQFFALPFPSLHPGL
jgi:hypothetical protein